LLLGRHDERSALDALVADARADVGGAIILCGEAGIGKTALLQHVVDSAADFQVFRTAGIEAEMELPFAAVQQLAHAATDVVAALPLPQRMALEKVQGAREGDAPDPLLVGLAVLTVLSELAGKRPLLCVVDDAQWLDSDSAQALAFAARRVGREAVVLLFAARSLTDHLAGLPALAVPPLGDNDARALLTIALPDRVDHSVMERLVAEAHGNPLALLEFPRGLTSAQLAGGFGLPASVPLAGRLEESFRRRLSGLCPEARLLLLVAAAESTGNPQLLWRACERLGIPERAAEGAEDDGLVQFDSRVVFRHPLVRSAIYNAASPKERRRAHAALAAATDRATDPDRRAWHLAQATLKANEDVAVELESSATRAQARGGFAAAAAFLERAMELSSEPSRRAARALAAAEARFRAGSIDDALALLEIAAHTEVDEYLGAKVDLLRGTIVFVSNRGRDATRLLLNAAQRLESLDPRLARATYLQAFSAAMFAGRLAEGGGAESVSEAVLSGPPIAAVPSPSELLLHGLALQSIEGPIRAAPLVKQALRAFQDTAVLPPEEERWLWFASWVALFMWDDSCWEVLSTRQLALIRQTGELSALPFVLSNRSSVFANLGELDAAVSLEEELLAVTQATGIAAVPYGSLSLTALRGREDDFGELVRTIVDDAKSRGEGAALSVTEFASGTFYNGLSRYDEAVAVSLPALEFHSEGPAVWALTELIEAAVRTGQPELAQRALELVVESTSAAGTDWALGIEARSRALLSDGDAADALYQEAIERLRQTRIRVQLARTHLLYGEWLRRERRGLDARAQLRTALDLFEDCGAEAFAARARIELEATGERLRIPPAAAGDGLTPQESQITRLVCEGMSNREIAGRLFISSGTVEYHLHKVFRKLNVKSRVQLARRNL
jgi:DNA-binding CsgD family transcriptional regulator/tetratricopeptide (TPR) repeat protein